MLYSRAARFDSSSEAGRIYGKVQAILLADRNSDISSYRFIHEEHWYVLVLGTIPRHRTRTALENAIPKPFSVPDSILEAFLRRRRDSLVGGASIVEKHHRPGVIFR